MSIITQKEVDTFLKENNIPHSENNIKNCSTLLSLINYWAKCDSEIPFLDSEHEPQARANFDLMKAKAKSLGIKEMDKYTFTEIFEEGKGLEAIKKLYYCIVVEKKTLSPLKRQSYDGRRAKYGTALNWKKELEIVQQALKEEGSSSEDEKEGTDLTSKFNESNEKDIDSNSNSKKFLIGVASVVGVAAVVALSALR